MKKHSLVTPGNFRKITHLVGVQQGEQQVKDDVIAIDATGTKNILANIL